MTRNVHVPKKLVLVSMVLILAMLLPAAAYARVPAKTLQPAPVAAGQALGVAATGSSAPSAIESASFAAARRRGKWIEVDLSRQRVMARQGNKVLRTFVVSTGTRWHPTPTGRFRIYVKLRSTTMSGPGYHLKHVPHTMYFYRGYGLHGTYWHHSFGHPMSHGCINLKRGDAAWLFRWAPRGTLVVIHR